MLDFPNLNQAVLAKQFRPAKPEREIDEKAAAKDVPILASRKYNGNLVIGIKESGAIRLFQSSCIALTPFLAGKKELWEKGPWREALQELPDQSFFLGEVFIPNDGKQENLREFQQWRNYVLNVGDKSQPKPAKMVIFDMLALDGKVIAQRSYGDRFSSIPLLLKPQLAQFRSLQQAKNALAQAEAQSIEGYVFWDATAPSYCKITGKHNARNGAWKVKPTYIEQFGLLQVLQATKENLLLRLSNALTMFQCGSGLTMDERAELLERVKAGKTLRISVTHYGYDDRMMPDLPRMTGFTLL